jgi:histidinol-phosphate aminotransferase
VLCRNEYLYTLKRDSYVVDVGDKLRSYGWRPDETIDCALGTNPFGAPASAREAYLAAVSVDFSRYPDPWADKLREVLAHVWEAAGVTPEEIVVGPGSMGLLERLNKLFLFPGARVLGYAPQFSEYVSDARANGAVYTGVKLKGRRLEFSLTEFLAHLGPELTLVYLDNPNNPTGQLISLDALRVVLTQALQHSVPVVVDEAYGDFVSPENSAIHLVREFPNLVVTRSFSKGLGLAGLRVGYAVLSGELRSLYERVDLPFSVAEAAIKAACVSARDTEFVENSRTGVGQVKAELLAALKVLSASITHPTTPIVALTAPDPSCDLRDAFLRQGVIVESGADFPGLTAATVRLRVPARGEELLVRLAQVERRL